MPAKKNLKSIEPKQQSQSSSQSSCNSNEESRKNVLQKLSEQQQQTTHQEQQQQQPQQLRMLCKRVEMTFPNFEPQFSQEIREQSNQLNLCFEEIQTNKIRSTNMLQILCIIHNHLNSFSTAYEILKVVLNLTTQEDYLYKLEEMYCSCTFYENNGSCDHLYRFLQKIDEEEIIEDYEYSHNHNQYFDSSIYSSDEDSSFEDQGLGFLLQHLLGHVNSHMIVPDLNQIGPYEPQQFKNQRNEQNTEMEKKMLTRETINTNDTLNPEINKEIKCQICLDVMKHPVILPCYCHSACFNCIKQQINLQFQSSEETITTSEGKLQTVLSCPTCRKQGGTKTIFSYQNLNINTELERVILSYETQLNKFQSETFAQNKANLEQFNQQKVEINQQQTENANLKKENINQQNEIITLTEKLEQINNAFKNVEQIIVQNNEVKLSLSKFEGIFSDLKNNENENKENNPNNQQKKSKKQQQKKKMQQTQLQKYIQEIQGESYNNKQKRKTCLIESQNQAN